MNNEKIVVDKPYLIQKGEVRNPKGKPKGALSQKRKAWELIGESLMNECSDKFMVEMNKLEGTAYINAFLNIMEYFKPKLSRSETINQNENIETITVTLSQTLTVFPDNVDEIEHEDISCLPAVSEPDRTQA